MNNYLDRYDPQQEEREDRARVAVLAAKKARGDKLSMRDQEHLKRGTTNIDNAVLYADEPRGENKLLLTDNDIDDAELLRALEFGPDKIGGESKLESGAAETPAPERPEFKRSLEDWQRMKQRKNSGEAILSDGNQDPEEDRSGSVLSKEEGPKVYRSEQDRNRARMDEGRAGVEEKRKAEAKEIQSILSGLEGKQNEQKSRQRNARGSAYALMAGEAVSAGFANRPMQMTQIPEKYDVAKAELDRLNVGNNLNKTSKQYEDQDLDRLLGEFQGIEKNVTNVNVNNAKEKGKDLRQEDKQEFDSEENKKAEAARLERAKIMARSGLAGKILSLYSSSNNQANRADADYANKQATFQIPQWDQIKPNSPTDHSRGAELAGAEEAFWQVGTKLADGLRKNGPAFPQSTEWKNVAGDYMALNQALNFLNHNGVMNFKDKDNNDVQIGNAQEFIQYVLQNGPDVLEHALKTMRTGTDARMNQLGYSRSKSPWSAKTPKNYLDDSSGGSGKRAPMDPNTLGGLGDWALQGGKPPVMSMPGADPGTPPIPAPGEKQKPKFKVVKDANGNWVPVRSN